MIIIERTWPLSTDDRVKVEHLGSAAIMLRHFILIACVCSAILAPQHASGQPVSVNISDCNFPPEGGNSSSAELPTTNCPRQAVTNATLAAAKADAWRYAPLLHFHPLEPYYLQVRRAADQFSEDGAVSSFRGRAVTSLTFEVLHISL